MSKNKLYVREVEIEWWAVAWEQVPTPVYGVGSSWLCSHFSGSGRSGWAIDLENRTLIRVDRHRKRVM